VSLNKTLPSTGGRLNSPFGWIVERLTDDGHRLGVRGVLGDLGHQRWPAGEPGAIDRFALCAHESVGEQDPKGGADRGGGRETGKESILTFACER
jgi:hypothetical protein